MDTRRYQEGRALADQLEIWARGMPLTRHQQLLVRWYLGLLRHRLERQSGMVLSGADVCAERWMQNVKELF